MNKKGVLAILLSALLCVVCVGCSSSTSESGDDSVTHAIIQWAEGGGTDSVVRPLIELADADLSTTVETENMVGMAGAQAFQYVYNQEADGTYLLMGAENPALYGVLGYSEQTYADFDCVCLIGSEVVGVVVPSNSPYQSFKEIVDAALDGDSIVMSTTNVGGMPWTVASMVESITGAEFVQQWYNGDAAAEQAVIDGEVDFTFCKVQIGLEDYEAGKLQFLNVLSEDEVELMPGVPSIVDEFPDFADYLPWGPFYGVFVKSGTPDEKVEELRDAFMAAWEDESYQTLLEEKNITPLGLYGDEANEYIQAWEDQTVAILEASDMTYSLRFNAEE